MNPELKTRLRWLSPLTFDGNPVGAFVRTAEMLAADVGLMLLGSKIGIDCGGALAIGTLILMGAQFAVTDRHEDTSRGDWRRNWNLKQQYRARAEADHPEPLEEHHEVHHDDHH